MTNKARALEIHDLLIQGQLLEAFDKFYHEDVVIEEPRGTWKGKVACRKHEVEFLAQVKEFHGIEVINYASNETTGVVFIETKMDVTFQDGNRVQMEQISRQKWKHGQVFNERFYYNNAPPAA
ncbi:MAG: hypothetical protein ACI83W_001992 [Marinoscillum sp.]|jgi:hypothetical protein